ncbi:MAG: aminotransferase class V-fold PLP-dependent enzyme [Leptospiraceae bacterium]|nr:aminotransferase class V-fold PLP-dependent enzyme [Leptospiraceae bacterium]MDW8307626.1 aminotransferase class V-fold PLP-dependent enzyme [Leptospiraceae bacterium]
MIYLDFNATASPDEEVLKHALEVYLRNFGNSSGLSFFSQKSFQLVEQCRERISQLLGLSAKQVIFTSSATEANHIFITTLWLKALKEGRVFRPLLSQLEHPSIVELVLKLPHTEILWYGLSNRGELKLDGLEEKIERADAAFMMAAHNESGMLLPLESFFELVQEKRRDSLPLLCDASQVLRHIHPHSPIKSDFFSQKPELPLFFSLASHKIGAGMGCGLLLRPRGTWGDFFEENTLFVGGNQEYKIRSGTHNLMAIYAMTLKLEKLIKNMEDYEELRKLTQSFEEKIERSLKPLLDIEIIGKESERLAGTSLVLFRNLDIDFFLMALDQEGVVVSTGTSCKSRSRTASPGLLSMGYTEEEALSVIRFSFDTSFNEELQQQVVGKMEKIIQELVVHSI